MISCSLVPVKLKGDGETVPVTEVIGYLGEERENIPTAGAASPEASPVPVASTSNDDGKSDDAFDIVVIGGGPAGYVAAIKAAQLGGKVALVEKSELGGTCLNRGCIPTKTYLHNAEIIENIGHAANRGIVIENPNFTVDMEKLLETKSKVVNTLVGGVAGLLRSYGVTVHKGIGTITKDKNVLVNGSELLETKKIILAGGSKVSKINVSGMESSLVMTSDDILEMNEVPESLVIIGGGVVGIELGQAFMTFGSKVTVIEMMDRIVPAMDAEVSKNLRLILERKGMTIMAIKYPFSSASNSMLTLSVMISKRISPSFTNSPTFLFHWTICPSVISTPAFGIITSKAMSSFLYLYLKNEYSCS